MTQLIHMQETNDSLFSARELEKGNILFFPTIPFSFPKKEKDFLLNQRQRASKGRKNIAYKPQRDLISNHEAATQEEAEKMHAILRNYSQRVTNYLKQLLPSYEKCWKLDYASFRPFQEKGRNLRMRARNDLLHIDSFPTRPMHGTRILRFFTNINPTESRYWLTSHSFEELALRFGGKELPFPKGVSHSFARRIERKLQKFLVASKIKRSHPSPYDRFMLKMHHFLKENKDFQKNCPKNAWSFPPNSCWAVFTDQVSHAALSGQYALEQTYLVPTRALLYPDRSPISILERLSNRNMVDPVHAPVYIDR